MASDDGQLWLSARKSIPIFNGGGQDLILEIEQIFENWMKEKPLKSVISAIHVGGLNSLNANYIEALRSSRLVYADGISVEILARVGGLQDTRRVPTTDLGFKILESFKRVRETSPKVAFIGGPLGLATKAGQIIQEMSLTESIFTSTGYKSADEWKATWRELSRFDPDLVFLGLGSPREALLLHESKNELPPALYITCGGWFGFICGAEKRAPNLLRKMGLEWLYRLASNPKRLMSRYLVGAYRMLLLTASVLWTRRVIRPD